MFRSIVSSSNASVQNHPSATLSRRLDFWRALSFSAVALLALPAAAMAEGRSEVELVSAGKACSVLVIPKDASDNLRKICESFARIVQKATGAELKIVTEGSEEKPAAGILPIYVGSCEATAALPECSQPLEAEEYRIYVRPDGIYLLGEDNPAEQRAQRVPSQPLRWALNRLLDDGLGVRFLWPGELGTYIPSRVSFALPVKEISYRPRLEIRNLRLSLNYPESQAPALLKIQNEAIEWSMNQQIGRRVSFLFGHAFIGWWEKYGKEHPEYFSLTPPPGMPKPDRNAPSFGKTAKLHLSNPEVIEQIAKEYTEAGAPALYNVCPNDHGRFDISPETLVWDDPAGQSLSDIWLGIPSVNLTSRYVHFWNLVAERLRKVNPDVTLLSYAYMAYRFPPKEGFRFNMPMKIALVDSWDAYDTWKGWLKSGAELYLRPNWGFSAGPAPLMPLEEIHRYLSMTIADGLKGFDVDSIQGNWAAEGINYYLIARTLQRPELSREAIVEEYVSAFGAAAPEVHKYLDYWQKESSRLGYASLAGYSSGPGGGEYRRLQEEKKTGQNYFAAPYEALPYLYQDKLLKPAFAFLEEAKAAAKTEEEKARVQFLWSGLENTRLTRDLIELGTQIRKMRKNEDKSALMKEYREKVVELDRFRDSVTATHAVWAQAIKGWETRGKTANRLP